MHESSAFFRRKDNFNARGRGGGGALVNEGWGFATS